jgi:hypothetical protein
VHLVSSTITTLRGVDSFSKGMDDKKKEDLMELGHNVIQRCLFDDIMREVVEENSVVELWIKLETHT